MPETDKLWRTNPTQNRAEKMARELRAGETVICETPSSAHASLKALRKVLTHEELSRLIVSTAVGTIHRSIRLPEPREISQSRAGDRIPGIILDEAAAWSTS